MGTSSPSEEVMMNGQGPGGDTTTAAMFRPLHLVFQPYNGDERSAGIIDEDDPLLVEEEEEGNLAASPSGNTPSISLTTEEEEEEDESEEEDLDFLDEDEEDAPESEALFDHLYIAFRNVLDVKVRDTERYFDSGALLPKKHCDAFAQTEEEQCSSSFAKLELGSQNVSEDKGKMGSVHSEGGRSAPEDCVPVELNSTHTQTDDTVTSVVLSVVREGVDVARSEVEKLRKAREPLHLEMASLAGKYKGCGSTKSESDERNLYELEEAIEAIDTAVEFKNELICGREVVLSNSLAPGQERAQLITRLASLSVYDLQRLFCKSFSKVVELRFCTKQLERDVDKLKEEKKRMRRKIHMDSQVSKEKDKEHETRISFLIKQCTQDPEAGLQTHIMFLEHELSKTKRKLQDFQLSLTELLIRHGYLLNGADYEVNQVIQMLGLDLDNVRNPRERDRSKHSSERNSTPFGSSRAPLSTHKRSRHQRRNAEVFHTSEVAVHALDGPSQFNSRRHTQQQSNPEQPGRHGSATHAPRHSTTSRPFTERETERESRRPKHGRENHNFQTQSGTDVQKLKNKIILHHKNPLH